MAWQRTATKGVYYNPDKKRYKITWRQRRNDGIVYQTSAVVGSLEKAKKIKKLADEYGDRPDYEGVIRGTDFVGHRGRSYIQTPRKILTTSPTCNSIEHYMPRFLASHGYRRGSRSESTARSHIICHLIPAFLKRPMRDITATDVAAFLRELESTEMSGATIVRLRSTASAMWTDAARDGIVTGNPWRGAKLAKQHVKRDMYWPSSERVKKIIDAIDQPSYKFLVRVIYSTGLRWSEAAALEKNDVISSGVVGNIVKVRKAKSDHGVRDIPISAELADELRQALPFRGPKGKRVRNNDFHSTAWDRAVEGMLCGADCEAPGHVHPRPPFRVHDLRHAWASLQLARQPENISATEWPEIVRKRGGWSSLEIMRIYAHAKDNGHVIDPFAA